MVLSTKSRMAARLSLFPGETISITAMVRPRWCLSTIRFARGVNLLRGAAHKPRNRRYHGRDAGVVGESQTALGLGVRWQNVRFRGRTAVRRARRHPSADRPRLRVAAISIDQC